jgi:hypothetical protein
LAGSAAKSNRIEPPARGAFALEPPEVLEPAHPWLQRLTIARSPALTSAANLGMRAGFAFLVTFSLSDRRRRLLPE